MSINAVLPQKMKVGLDKFFDMHPEFKNAYPCYDDKTERTCMAIDRLADRVWSLERTLSRRSETRSMESDVEQVDVVREKEWVTYKELIELYDFRGVKSAKDPRWRKQNGFEDCVSQAGKGCAVTFVVAKVEEWLSNKKKVSKQKLKHKC